MKIISLFCCLFCLSYADITTRHATGKPTESIHQSYEHIDAWGMLTSLDIHSCDPDLIRSSKAIKEYVIELCDLIEMKRYGDTQVVHFGEDEEVAGFSMTQLIETSLISGHFANKTNNIYIDIFSCKKYDPYLVAEFTKEYFKGKGSDVHIVLRK